jgi:hypothetical protein
MFGLSIQLKGLGLASQYLDSQKILPIHKEKLETCLSKIFKEQLPFQSASYQIQFKNNQPVLQLNGKEVGGTKGSELKRIRRVVRYYQNVGLLPCRDPEPSEQANLSAKTKSSVKAINNASLPGANGNILAGMRLADDTLSLARNILFAIPAIGRKDPIVNHLGYYAGIFWSFFSIREFDEGITEYKRSTQIRDAEGERRATARLLSGGLVSTGSLAYLAGKFCDTYASAGLAAAVLGVSNILFGVGSILAIGASSLGAIRCKRFNQRLNEYLENESLSEAQKLMGVVRFLKESLMVTAEEKADLIAEIEEKFPNSTKEEKEALLDQKLNDLTEVKVKYMKRRTSNKSLLLILSNADAILAKLANPETCAEGMRDAAILIHSVQMENRLKLNLYILGLIASILSFIGMIVMFFMTAGSLPFILYGIAGTMYLGLTSYTIAGNFLKKEADLKVIPGN